MDNTFVIDNLLRQNESDVLEFKEKYSPEVIAKNVTAMLNNRGGDILVGITDDKQVIGIDKGVDIGKFLSKLLSEITPSAPIDVQLVDYDGKNILMIRVWEGSQKPYSYKGTIFQKIGNRGKSLSKILSDRKDADINWERLPLLGADLSDLDMEEVKKTVDHLQESGKSMTTDTEEFLINNGLIQNGNITNACALLYAKNPSRFYTQCVIRLSVFSSDSPSDLVETRNYAGNIFKNAEAIFQFFDEYYKKSIVIDAPQRTEKWNYPRVAVREGVMNAIVHRDYSFYQGFLHIQVYPTHLDILNYGTMEPIVSYATKGILEYSMLRNPDIAYQCYYRKLIEMRGTGIMRMNDECKKLGLNPPVFSIDGDVVKVSFSIRQWGANSTGVGMLEKMLDTAIRGLSSNVRIKMLAVLDNINNKPGIKSLGLSDTTGIPKKTVDRYLSELKKANIIRYEGSDKNGGFHINNDFME
ncbi:MAG: putative DNA binding domain-containing protein [Bacteroidales bacterium]|nr:putative DNA binding domain-containing protein [Bacteroidales bacterium]